MQPAAFDPSRRNWQLGLLAMLACLFAYLLKRNLGLYPFIFADEWYYSKYSRLVPLADAIIPSYLYLWLFRGSSACGDGFLDCVRVLNVVFYVGAAPFIYLTARQVTGKALALFITLLCMLAPANLYTAFFMPESTYYFGFAVLSWIALTRSHWHWARYAAVTGSVLGLMSLVKVHALFLLPALCLFLLYVSWNRQRQGGWFRIALLSMGLAAALMFAVKFGLGYALAGNPALNLFGSFYANAANSTAHRSVLSLLAPALINGRGHLEALAVLLALPLAILLHAVASGALAAQPGDKAAMLRLYALLMLGAAAGMTVLYTASIAGLGPQEVLRLHLRYYAFVFPLMFMIGAPTGQPAPASRPALKWVIAGLVAAVLLIALVKLPTYSLNVIDGPEIATIGMGKLPGQLLVGLDLLILLLWARGSAAATALFLFVALPATIAGGIHGVHDYMGQRIRPWAADNAGRYAHTHVPASERNQITVAGSDIGEMMQVQFHIDGSDVAMLELPKGAPIEAYQLPVRRKWLLVLGPHALPGAVKPVFATPEFALAVLPGLGHTRPIGAASLSAPFGRGLIASAEGLSGAENWGRWSDAKQVVLHFNAPLPKHLAVILRARAYEVNTTLPFTMWVGASAVAFRLSGAEQEISLHLETDGTERTLTIDVPHPLAPSELGRFGDERKLGIGLSEIEIGAVEDGAAPATQAQPAQ